MKSYFCVVLFLCARVLFAADLFEVSGTVRDPIGHPVEQAHVLLDSREVATTATDGTFEFQTPAGIHTMRIVHNEFQASDEELQVSSSISNLAITLEP